MTIFRQVLLAIDTSGSSKNSDSTFSTVEIFKQASTLICKNLLNENSLNRIGLIICFNGLAVLKCPFTSKDAFF